MKTCRTQLLTDSPAKDDFFNNSHKKVADSIIDLITNEPGGITIGIEGNWGTGKSTIVKFIDNHFSQPNFKDHQVLFLFDAWAHEGDPLRRSFLEQLISLLKDKKWIGCSITDKWETKLSGLTGRSSKSKTTNTPRLTFSGVIIACLTFLIPIGVAIINGGLRNNATYLIQFNLPADKELILGTLLTIAPFLGIIVIFLFSSLCYLIKLFISHLKKAGKPEFPKKNLSLFIQKYDSEVTSFTTKDIDPTSVEFESFFLELVKDTMHENSNKLIIVVDNLDRIDPADGIKILSTLQTFLQCRNYESESALKRIYIIIPYDQQGIGKLWNDNFDKKRSIPFNNSTTSGITTSMLDKRFQIRFRVPPIVLSDWESYFVDNLMVAFPDHPRDEFHLTYSFLYQYYKEKANQLSPTPREIKILINQLGTLHRQWEDTIPLTQMAYFLFLIDEHHCQNEFTEKILAEDFPIAFFNSIAKEEIIQNFAMMYFNVDKALAMQLIIEKKITYAIDENNISKLNELCMELPISFWTIFDKLPIQMWRATAANYLCSIAIFLLQSKDLPEVKYFSYSVYKKKFFDVCNLVSSWGINSDVIANGVYSMIKLQPNITTIQTIFTTILQTEFLKEDTEKPFSATSYQKSNGIMYQKLLHLSKIHSGVREISTESQLKIDKYTINLYPIDTIIFLANLEGYEDFAKLEQFFQVEFNAEDIESAFIDIISNTLCTNLHLEVIKWFYENKKNLNFNLITNSIFQNYDLYSSENLAVILEIICFVELKFSTKFRPISESNRSNIFYSILGDSSKTKNYMVNAWCYFLLLISPNDAITQQNPSVLAGQSTYQVFISGEEQNTDPCFLEYFIKIVNQYNIVKKIIDTYGNNKSKYKGLCTIISKYNQLYPLTNELEIAYINLHWTSLRELLGIAAFRELISKINDQDSFFSEIKNSFELEKASLYLDIYVTTINKSSKKTVETWLINNLENITTEDWKNQLINEKIDVLDLILELINSNVKLTNNVSFLDAYLETCMQITNGTFKPKKYLDQWVELIKFVGNKSKQDQLKISILEKICNTDSSISQAFFEIFGNTIANANILNKTTGIIRRFFSKIVKEKNESGIIWIENFFSKDKSFLPNYENQTEIEDLKMRLEALVVEDIPNISKETIENIKKQIDLGKDNKIPSSVLE